ncbi:hypothetical protein D3C72_2137870 [compost metagenome]
MASTIIPRYSGLVYQVLLFKSCLGVKLYTRPTSSFSSFALVNKLMAMVDNKHTINEIEAMVKACPVAE